jgi:hypothetical protein
LDNSQEPFLGASGSNRTLGRGIKMSNKIFFVERADHYGERGLANGVAYYSEDRANEVAAKLSEKLYRSYVFMVQELEVKYSHRNGETDDPEVDGWYWVEWRGQWTLEKNPIQNPYNDPLVRYFGPIPTPEVT